MPAKDLDVFVNRETDYAPDAPPDGVVMFFKNNKLYTKVGSESGLVEGQNPDPVPEPEPEEPTENYEPVEGEVRALNLNPQADLNQIPIWQHYDGAISLTATNVPFSLQAKWAKEGRINYVHLSTFVGEQGGFQNEWNPQGKTDAQLAALLASYAIPASVGNYSMLYQSAVDNKTLDNAGDFMQSALNTRIYEQSTELSRRLGWTNHPNLCDVDFEAGPYTYQGIRNLATAMAYTNDTYTGEIEWQVYSSAYNNFVADGGGNAANPWKVTSPQDRYQVFKAVGTTVYQSTAPYFLTPGLRWSDPSFAPSAIGPGKLYKDENEYAQLSIFPIGKKLAWSDAFYSKLPAGERPKSLEWWMVYYEGSASGAVPFPIIGNFVLESAQLWGLVAGSFRFGGGVYNWHPGGSRLIGQDYIEAGKWRAAQFNRFWNDESTILNIKLEFSLDGGKTWEIDTKFEQGSLLDQENNPRPILRAAYRPGELLIVATAGQPYHRSKGTQKILTRYQGKQFELSLVGQTVHAFTKIY